MSFELPAVKAVEQYRRRIALQYAFSAFPLSADTVAQTVVAAGSEEEDEASFRR